MILQVDEELLRRLRRHAEATYPEEAAGLILGKAGSPVRLGTRFMPLGNRSHQAERHYRFDAQDMLAAEMQAQLLGLDLVGIFHSHPDQPARPSQHDLQGAFPWFSYVIAGVIAGKTDEIKSWRLRQDRSRWSEERLEILFGSGLKP